MQSSEHDVLLQCLILVLSAPQFAGDARIADGGFAAK